jgi:orotidine-5'-phosphate decarboxylase
MSADEAVTVTSMNDGFSQSGHPGDRLLHSIAARRSPVCVGIDPVLERLPTSVRSNANETAAQIDAIGEYCSQLIRAVAPHVPCIKFQSACFERYSWLGVRKLRDLITTTASLANVEIILDAKRGDIGVTAEHYSADAFGRANCDMDISAFDWMTINSYLGEDGIKPFLDYAGHGAFALVRTSNPSGDEIQNLKLQDGRTVSHAVAEMIARIGSNQIGECGYSSLGAVVGVTKKHDAARLRQLMPQQIFLVPGYGAQGGGVQDVLPCFKPDGTGAIVTASRSVIYAFDPGDPKWYQSVDDAAAKFAEEIGRAVGMR